MFVGVPREIKPQENRVGLIPGSVREIIRAGSHVLVEKGAGLGIGISDEQYITAGAEIVATADEVFERAELIVKVKEPQPIECKRLREGQTLFTYLHLAPDPLQTRLLKESGATAIAYETVTQNDGGLPLLTPMSQVAGRMSIQAGAHCLEMAQGGSGVLLGGVPGVAPANVVVIGGGVVGSNAIRMAMGMEARVIVIDKSLSRLRELDFQFGSKLNTIYATVESLEHYVKEADLVIGAVLVPGAAAPRLVTRAMLKSMRPGSVVVDVAIDQGGCFETSKPTTHQEPTYVVDNVVHYCVANMPGAVPRTSTFALNNATLPFVISLVTKGIKLALLSDGHLLNGLNVHKGMITYEAVARDLGYEYIEAAEALAS
ncbi:alanine dehydrogenase [Legionella jamestowniensis]|uniref:Alanine dehydrogenase n=1 Tax=Legionella jamestowniensis TaxID=455 RepID=A0A0W0UGW8_9GAMM|nr:alanine dehydrogenase [Legionella jamestowniensis]KTD07156.1 alanine dehydrogenase [Legionella jamestowniensis]OCH98893.1 alanine dehydrogenase [Legionella jamestowniensis]SFL71688.1 alanine dehydrogenase [Legionella jamestowniensis DSM 19215]